MYSKKAFVRGFIVMPGAWSCIIMASGRVLAVGRSILIVYPFSDQVQEKTSWQMQLHVIQRLHSPQVCPIHNGRPLICRMEMRLRNEVLSTITIIIELKPIIFSHLTREPAGEPNFIHLGTAMIISSRRGLTDPSMFAQRMHACMGCLKSSSTYLYGN